jgi:Tfp pilus assembly protein PilV
MTPPGRRTPPAEDGFALIEVLVSALVLAIAAAGVLNLLQASARSGASQRHHAEAYAIAQEDQARLRSMRLFSLNRLEQKLPPVTVDGTEFTVESTGTYVDNLTSKDSSCVSGSSSSDYVRITSKVTWPELGSRPPVVMQSIVSPSNGSLDPTHGTLIVTTKNAAGGALAGVGIKGTGPGTFSGTTDSSGCANFADLPSGNYTVTPSGTDLVDIEGNLPPKSTEIGVPIGGSATLSLQDDRKATVPVQFQYKSGTSSALMPAKLDTVFVYHSLIQPGKAYFTAGKVPEYPTVATPIFPFATPVTVYAGVCDKNNPGIGVGQISNLSLQPGVTTAPVTLRVPAVELTVKSGASIVTGAKITITDEKCKDAEGNTVKRVYTSEANGHQSSSTTGAPEYGLPWGSYEVCASAVIGGTKRRLKKPGVLAQSFSSNTVQTLDISGSGSTANQECP